MNVLISEDDDCKFQKIANCLISSGLDLNIVRRKSVRGTIKYLKENDVFMLVQDMNLPVFEDETFPKWNSGLDVVFSVYSKGKDIAHKVVCSSDPDVGDDFKDDLDMCGFKFVHFDVTRSLDVNSFIGE